MSNIISQQDMLIKMFQSVTRSKFISTILFNTSWPLSNHQCRDEFSQFRCSSFVLQHGRLDGFSPPSSSLSPESSYTSVSRVSCERPLRHLHVSYSDGDLSIF